MFIQVMNEAVKTFTGEKVRNEMIIKHSTCLMCVFWFDLSYDVKIKDCIFTNVSVCNSTSTL